MKRLSLLLLIIGLIFFCAQSTSAQENKKKKEAKVKILMNKDGKTIKFDTTLHDFKDHKELMKIMKSKNLPDSLLEVFEGENFMWISDDKDSHGKHKIIIKECLDSDSKDCKKIKRRVSKNIQIISSDNDHENIIITEGDGEHKTIKIEIIDEDGNLHLKHKKGEKVFIIKEDIDMDISEDGDVKIIKIDCTSDHDEDIEIEVEVSEDGKTTKKIKRKKKKAKKTEKKEK